jgi:uncharacterized protein (DUF362 family)
MKNTNSRVSVVSGAEIEASVRKAIDLIGGIRQIVHPGQTVLIKPNFGGGGTAGDRDCHRSRRY